MTSGRDGRKLGRRMLSYGRANNVNNMTKYEGKMKKYERICRK